MESKFITTFVTIITNGVPDIFDSHCHILQPFQHSGDFLQEPLMLAALLVLQCFLGLSQVAVNLLLIS